MAHLPFYSGRASEPVAVRIAGRYRPVRASTIGKRERPEVDMQREADSIEVHLPPASQYVALELEIA